jgi:copper chaperone CopZ
MVTLFGLALCLASCRQHEFRRASITVPEMKTSAAVELITRTIGGLPGVRKDKLAFNLERRQVTVVYDSLELGLKNIEFAIREAGFTANDIPAKPEAARALPSEVTGAVPGAATLAPSPVAPPGEPPKP